MKPENPFKKNTLIYALYEEGWSDLTIAQIAEVTGHSEKTVRRTIEVIKQKTGYDVPRTRARRGRKPSF